MARGPFRSPDVRPTGGRAYSVPAGHNSSLWSVLGDLPAAPDPAPAASSRRPSAEVSNQMQSAEGAFVLMNATCSVVVGSKAPPAALSLMTMVPAQQCERSRPRENTGFK